jgi:hypothetical protein
MSSPDLFESVDQRPAPTVTRRTVLKMGLTLAGVALLTACGSEPQDEAGLAKERARSTAVAATEPTPIPPAPKTFSEKMRALLVPGNTVEVWEGTYTFDHAISRRREPVIPNQPYCYGAASSSGMTFYNCRVKGENTDFWNRDEIIQNPLRVTGKEITYHEDYSASYGYGRDRYSLSPSERKYKPTETPVEGFAYYSPIHRTFMWIGLVTGDTDGLIRRNGVLYSNLRPVTTQEIKQNITIAEAKLEGDDKKPMVIAKNTNGEIFSLLVADTSKVLRFF